MTYDREKETKSLHEETTMEIKDTLNSSTALTSAKDALRSSTDLTSAEDDPFEIYATAALANEIVGDLLKCSKGDWVAGQENRPIALGTEIVANMDSSEVGWVRWF